MGDLIRVAFDAENEQGGSYSQNASAGARPDSQGDLAVSVLESASDLPEGVASVRASASLSSGSVSPDDQLLNPHVLRGRADKRSRDRFHADVVADLVGEPVEDGLTHPLEDTIESAARGFPSAVASWLESSFAALLSSPALAAGFVQCMGRISLSRLGGAGRTVAIGALYHASPQVREAAVCAIENWENGELIEMLSRHREEVGWLGDYIDRVVREHRAQRGLG